MKSIKQIFALALVAMSLTACEETIFDREWDKPYVAFDMDSAMVGAEGGQIVVPVRSTGVSDVHIDYRNHFDKWENDESGNMYPVDGWITLNRVIEEYATEATRALPIWQQGLDLTIAPNDTGYERTAIITVESFTKHDTIEIIQSAK